MRLAKIKKTYLVAAAALAIGAMLCLPQFASAEVTGQCSNCHTMHNSQNNKPMTYVDVYSTAENPGGNGGSATPNNTLLRGNCLQCHTGTNQVGSYPFVYNSSAPTYTTYDSTGGSTGGNTLAGGNFYWVDQSSDTNAAAYGHNVYMLPNHRVDTNLTAPPGYTGSSWNLTTHPLTCAGLYGCHGNRTVAGDFAAISGAHHTNNTSQSRDGSTLGNSFRFLLGVKGIEAANYELSVSANSHNEYYGVARTDDTAGVTIPSSSDSNNNIISISALCAECHGAFHNSSASYINANNDTVTGGIKGTAWGSPWIRHPTDFDMNAASGSEYANYGGTSHNYMPQAPVASDATSLTVLSTVLQTPGDAIVTCISCHRAHGSPYADLLRWDYTGMIAGPSTTSGQATGTGCFVCHTTKDGV